MINCLMIDDEPSATGLLENFAGRLPSFGAVLTFNEPLLAIDHMNTNEVDVIFLDIDMPGISGIDLFKSLNKKPEVVFISAQSEYAVQAFELGAADYLMKPFTFERFVMAINRAKERVENKKSRQPVRGRDYFFINISHKVHKIFYDDILYLEGFKDYTKLYMASSSSPLLVLHILKHFEDFLPAGEFVRVHRSYIIPLRKINTVSRKAVTIGNTSLPVSDNYRERLFSIIG